MSDTGGSSENQGVVKAVRPEVRSLIDNAKKEVRTEFIRSIIAGSIALIGFAVAGWWLVLKPYIVEIVGGIPAGAVIALDNPGGCAKLGARWEDGNFGGKLLVAASNDPRWNYRKDGGHDTVSLASNNLPPIYIYFSSLNSGGETSIASISGIGFEAQRTGTRSFATSQAAAASLDIMPPFVALYFCKRKE